MLFQRMAIRTAALVLFTSCLAARAGAPSSVSDPVFSYAQYGTDNESMNDVTKTIKEIIKSKNPSSKYPSTMNAILKGDSSHGKVKTLNLVFTTKIGPVDFPTSTEIGEYDMKGFWKFIESERAKPANR